MSLTKIHYVINDLSHEKKRGTGQNTVRAKGIVSIENKSFAFSAWLRSPDKGHWEILDPPIWNKNPPSILKKPSFWHELELKIDSLLHTINIWPDEQAKEAGARLSINEIKTPGDAIKKVFASFRIGLLHVPAPKWEDLWQRITNRVLYDPFFFVQGFNQNEVLTAINVLQQVFPYSWVKSKYLQRGCESMTGTYAHNDSYWFPAYHLARTACGAICVDPGWNYLVDVGLSLIELSAMPKIESIRKKIAQHPGLIYQLTLAGSFKRKGILIDLEPETGLPNYKNDFTINFQGTSIDLEVKVFTSGRPGARLETEIKKKEKELPPVPRRPIFIYAILAEKGWFSKDKEDKFFNEVQELGGRLPAQISGIAIGKMWLDSAGGRIKHSMHSVAFNPISANKINPDAFSKLYQNELAPVVYPQFGIPSLFTFGEKQIEDSDNLVE